MYPDLKNQFLLDENVIFLNHGSFGACSKPCYQDLLKWQKLLEKEPVYFFENTIINALRQSRQALSKFLNCVADDIVYFPNPTTAINAVIRSLDLKSGDEVLSTNHIYGALDRSWQYICKKRNAKFIKVNISIPIQSKDEFLSCFFNLITNNTKVVFISHITSMTGMIFPVEEIINFAKKKNILTIIDGAHAPGHINLDLQHLDADIYTGACHKWMCTPKGVSFLYVKKRLQEKIHPLVVSWGWKSDNPGPSKFLDWHEWQGTRDMSSFLTIPVAIKFMSDNDWPSVSRQCKKLVIKSRNKFIDLLQFPAPCPDHWLGQMASIPLPIKDANIFKNKLMELYKIQVPIFTWEGQIYLRYSIQAYNTEADIETLLFAVKELIG